MYTKEHSSEMVDQLYEKKYSDKNHWLFTQKCLKHSFIS